MQKLYNLTEVKKEIETILNIKIVYTTMWLWVKKGLIKSSATMKDGNRDVPVYTMEDIENFLEQYPIYREKGIIRRNYKRWEKKK